MTFYVAGRFNAAYRLGKTGHAGVGIGLHQRRGVFRTAVAAAAFATLGRRVEFVDVDHQPAEELRFERGDFESRTGEFACGGQSGDTFADYQYIIVCCHCCSFYLR